MPRQTASSMVVSLLLLVSWLAAAQEGGAPSQGKNGSAPFKEVGAPGALTLEKVQEKIKEIEGAEGIEEELKKKLLETYRKAQSSFEKAEGYRGLAESYKQAIETAPGQTQEIRDKLKEEAPVPKVEISPSATAKELENQVTKERAELVTAEEKVQALDKAIQDQQGRPEKAREEQAAARKRLEEIDKALKTEPPSGENPWITAANRAALEASQKARAQEVGMLEQEILSHAVRLDLLNAQKEEAAREPTRLKARLKQLEEAWAQRRDKEALDLKKETDRAKREAAGKHRLVQQLAEETSTLGDDYTRYVGEANAVLLDKRWAEDQRTQLKEIYEGTKGFLEQAGLEGIGGEAMRDWRDWRKRLPQLLRVNTSVWETWRGKIPQVEWRRFDMGLKVRKLEDLDKAVTDFLEKKREPPLSESQRAEIRPDVREQLAKQYETLKKLQENDKSYLKTLRELQAAQAEVSATIRDFAGLLDEWLLWIPSSSVVTTGTIADLGKALTWLFTPRHYSEVVSTFTGDMVNAPFWWVLAALIVGGLILGRRRLRAHVDATAGIVGRPLKDRFTLTLTALLSTLFLAAPAPVLLAFLGWRLRDVGGSSLSTFVPAFGTGLLAVAQVVIALQFFRLLCRPRGVGGVHFRWQEETIKLLRRHLRWLLPLLIVTTFIVSLTEAQSSDEVTGSLGRLAFIVGMGAQAYFIQRIIRPTGGITERVLTRKPEGWLARLRYVWYPLAVGIPVILAVLAAGGYYYTARELEGRMIATVWLIVGVALLNFLVLRWLVMEERRLALKQAREKRQAEIEAARAEDKAPDGGTELPEGVQEIPEVDITTINEQTRKMLLTVVGTAIILGLWFIWSSVVPALGILNRVELWSVSSLNEAGDPITKWITLQHIAVAIIAFILTAAASKNLPGVLEILILKRLPLEPGVRYALTAVSQYVLGAIGIVFAFNVIGLGWSKVQWLVAALSVGIGFGLQEIIANFFCGIILLFERPIRVGDIVTVGDVQGTVSRIRIRATTITNWDRMEYVVPNKELITGRLLNWTLSNTVNRIVVNVGVAYGSDTHRARELLLRVAADHPLIVEDPAPVATFEGFGDSTLNLVLRCYLPDFANRLATISELHTAIDAAFKEAGIEIAFPQLDLHVRSGGITARIDQGDTAPRPEAEAGLGEEN